ncbi:unnamed protein product, partial [Iphiclides podalirius]
MYRKPRLFFSYPPSPLCPSPHTTPISASSIPARGPQLARPIRRTSEAHATARNYNRRRSVGVSTIARAAFLSITYTAKNTRGRRKLKKRCAKGEDARGERRILIAFPRRHRRARR